MAVKRGELGPRSGEVRLRVECAECGGRVSVLKSQLRWADRFACENGHLSELETVLDRLHRQGWNVHDLARGRGLFREPIPSLPLPHGGTFAAGQPGQRSDDATRSGPRQWPFKSVELATPAEKGFKLFE